MLLRGTKRKTSAEFHRALDNIGAELHLGSTKRASGSTASASPRSCPAFLDLLEEMMTEPAFREDEFAKIRDQCVVATRRARLRR